MQPNKQSKERRVLVYLTTLMALVVLAVVLTACKKDETTGNVNGPKGTGPTPSPSPTPSGSPGTEMLPGDTIIVIKDGSVEIELKEGLCTLQNDSENYFFKCDGVHLADVMIRNEKGHAPARCPKLGAFPKVTIDGGGSKEIVVQDHLADTTIKFKKTDYPPCGISPLKYCGSNKVGTIKVGSYSKSCDPAEKCEVWMYKD